VQSHKNGNRDENAQHGSAEVVQGTPGADGLSVGRAWLWGPASVKLAPKPPKDGQTFPAVELVRLETAMREAEHLLRKHSLNLKKRGVDPEWLALVDAHIGMIRDPLLTERAQSLVANGSSAESAISEAAHEVSLRFLHTDSSSLTDLTLDIQQVKERIVRALLQPGQATEDFHLESQLHNRPRVVFASHLPPEVLLHLIGDGDLGTRRVRAICLDRGGPLSHSAILARHMGIPTVVGLGDLSSRVKPNQAVLVDGTRGKVILDPTQSQISSFRKQRHSLKIPSNSESTSPNTDTPPPPVNKPTQCSHPFQISANLLTPEEGKSVRRHGADGVGLLRTDSLLSAGGSAPTLTQQTKRYSRLVKALQGLPATIRLFDHPIAGYNPSMGIRGVRWLNHEPELLQTQISAICAAAAHGPTKILIPMVTHPDEIVAIRTLTQQAWKSMGKTEPAPPVGAMLETPAACLIADLILGVPGITTENTNDLLQGLMLADRTNPDVSHCLNPKHPALERALNLILSAMANTGTPVYICGELASQSDWAIRFLELGFTGISIPLSRVPEIRTTLTKNHPQS